MTDTKSHKTLQVSVTVLLLLSIASAVYYGTFLFNPANIGNIFVYSLLVFIEIYVILQTIGIWWTMLYANNSPKDHIYYENKKELINNLRIEGGVDILITTFGEDIETIRETVVAAKNLTIAHKTYILDDGRSLKVRELARELGVNYITRRNNKDKKAGNVNNSFNYITSKYFAIFDADHTPKVNFLIETLPFFWDQKVAFVQTPQVLTNRTNLISKGASDSQKIFYDIACTGKNKFNAMFWVGTNAIFRRQAIDEIGGIYPHSSEDILTSYRLHEKGWRSIYISDTLAEGKAPDKLDAYMKQQVRWAGGGFYIFFKENPLFQKLTLDQRIQYFLTSMFYFNGIVIFLMMIIPLLYLYFGIKPLSADITLDIWAIHYVPYFLFQFVVILVLTGRFTWEAYILSINSFSAYVKALIYVILNKPIKWNVTGGSGSSENKLNYLFPHIVILILTVFAIPVALVNIKEPGNTLFSMFWAICNATTIFIFIVLNLKEKNYKKLDIKIKI